jgi:TPR repeat protein
MEGEGEAPIDGATAAAPGNPADAAIPPAAPGPTNPAVVDVVSESGVRLRLTRRPRIDRPSPPYAAAYESLLPRAERGETLAQFQLGLMLYDCRDVPTEAASLAARIEQIHQTRRNEGWDVSDPAQEAQALRDSYEHCRGLPQEAREDYREWLVRAAEGGLVEAQLNLMFYLPKGEYCQFIEDCTPQQAALMAQLREESRGNVLAALESGAAEALRTLGGWALNDEMGTPDAVEAYAYFRAYDQVQQAAGCERELLRMLESLRQRLRPVDLDRAEARARELLSNPKCCVLTR